jgi:hypothetical protein
MISDMWLAGMSVLVAWLLLSSIAEIAHRRRVRKTWWTGDHEMWSVDRNKR